MIGHLSLSFLHTLSRVFQRTLGYGRPKDFQPATRAVAQVISMHLSLVMTAERFGLLFMFFSTVRFLHELMLGWCHHDTLWLRGMSLELTGFCCSSQEVHVPHHASLCEHVWKHFGVISSAALCVQAASTFLRMISSGVFLITTSINLVASSRLGQPLQDFSSWQPLRFELSSMAQRAAVR